MATPQEIASGASCYGACVPDVFGAILYELDQLRIAGGGAVMTPQEIAEASACYGQCVPDKMGAIIYLLDALVDAGGGGGGNPEVFALPGSDAPVAAPVGGAGVAYNVVGDVWVYSGGGWVLTIDA